MKKIIAAVAAVVLVLAIGVPAALAVGHGFGHTADMGVAHATSVAGGVRQAIADTRDALVNRAETASGTVRDNVRAAACPRFADEDGDGICDNCNRSCGSCPSYSDANDDGVCDNRAAGGVSGGGCQGGHQGCSNGRHNGYHHANR